MTPPCRPKFIGSGVSSKPGAIQYDEARKASWATPQQIKNHYRSASFVGHNRVVFNVHGNRYRLVVAVAYQFGAVHIKFVGTHADYDEIDAATVDQ
jgi:mRNA interferase HigB